MTRLQYLKALDEKRSRQAKIEEHVVDLDMGPMTQVAPYPEVLAQLVAGLSYRPGWTFGLVDRDRGQGSAGLTFVVTTMGYNSYHIDEGENYSVHHFFIVPAAAYNRASWQHWIHQQLLLVESHECCEFMMINGERPYAPNHSPGWDPYLTTVLSTEEERRTSFRGELNP